MQVRSNIGHSLNKKRKASLRKKIFYYFIFILFFLSLIVYILSTDFVRLKEIKVSGNSSISTEEIMNIVTPELNTYYLWIIPTKNIFLLRDTEIQNNILTHIKKIGETKVLINGLSKIEIVVKERDTKNLWCYSSKKKCYFMDPDGFIFEEAPTFSEDTFPEYFGLIDSDDPIGQHYMKDNFRSISALFETLKKISFWPKRFYALNENEYEIYIKGGGKIIMDNKKSFESQLINLQTLVTNNYIKTDEVSLSKIKYIDLRFGNKVNFELYK